VISKLGRIFRQSNPTLSPAQALDSSLSLPPHAAQMESQCLPPNRK